MAVSLELNIGEHDPSHFRRLPKETGDKDRPLLSSRSQRDDGRELAEAILSIEGLWATFFRVWGISTRDNRWRRFVKLTACNDEYSSGKQPIYDRPLARLRVG